MRLLQLEIEDVRGVRSLAIAPEGRNFVVYGPNGSGKSAVVDAIDFLLTGRMSRLAGAGTGRITLRQHGPHIDQQPAAALVRARIRLPQVAEPVQVERCIAEPSNLRCANSASVHLQRVIDVALRGQHMLTRRDILRYVTSEPGTRAQDIQALLNVSEIENIRQSLVRARNTLKREAESTGLEVTRDQGAVNSTTGESTFDREVLLDFVNNCRSVVGGNPIDSAAASTLKEGLEAPSTDAAGQQVSARQLQMDLNNLAELAHEDKQDEIAKADDELRRALVAVRSSPEAARTLDVLDLTLLGIGLIDETGRCPLCETEWPPGELLGLLQERVGAAQAAKEQYDRVNSSADITLSVVHKTISSLEGLIESLEKLGEKIHPQYFPSWLAGLKDLGKALEAPLQRYPDGRFALGDVSRMLAPVDVADQLEAIRADVQDRLPKSTPEQDAWDSLTRLEENLKQLEAAESELVAAKDSFGRAQLLLDSFLEARDEILGGLYDRVKDRFVEFYRVIHGEDEKDFTATIEPQEAGLVFEVDFYGRGSHAPHALHSEGHQDSMGLCLYLALAERLTSGVIDLIMLDDVVMSVDSAHRRRVCDLLARYFPDRQFLITTHDKTWANQLRASGIVEARSMLEFYNWHVETGPLVNYEPDMWQRIETALEKEEIDIAAGLLRRGAEHFFALVCDALGAQVRYTLDHREELGDLLPGAISRYRKLLRRAKNAAQSWGNQDRFEELRAIDSVAGEVYARTGAEQWAVNAAVHYNSWANLSRGDFRPVVDAFRDLYALFICPQCGGMLYLVQTGYEPVGLRCNCGEVNWSLVQRGASQ
jgi:energy-coupling factor transporter ATP-binding protein EcfA2